MLTNPRYSQERQFLDLPSWAWLWLPLAYVLAHYAAAGAGRHTYARVFGGGELGNNELWTMTILVLAVIVGLHTLNLVRRAGDWRLTAWLLLGSLGCIYFAGEEASWGQHLIGWDSSAGWQRFNDQGETNLHNSEELGFLLDQLPRNLLTVGMLVGGVFAPLYRRFRGMELNPAHIHFWIWPTAICLPVGLLAGVISWPESIYEAITGVDHPERFDISSGELKEWLIGYFLLLYLASFNLRLRQLLRDGD
ncbi:MAG: hypothetical protein ACRETN_07310 [Nevskiales bacterium]